MKHRYKIEGMTCNSCVAKVNDALSAVAGVKQLWISLEKGEASIEMEHPVPIETLREALPAKYSIAENTEKNVLTTTVSEPGEENTLQQLFPLFLIFGYIVITAIFLNVNQERSIS